MCTEILIIKLLRMKFYQVYENVHLNGVILMIEVSNFSLYLTVQRAIFIHHKEDKKN